MPKVTQYVDKQLFVCDILNNFWHIPLFKQIIMKYKLFSLFFMLLLPISGHAQNATILFSTEQDCEISIYEPIDGGYNNQLPTTILKVTTISHVFIVQTSSHLILYIANSHKERNVRLFFFQMTL